MNDGGENYGLMIGGILNGVGSMIFGIYSIYHIFFKDDFISWWNDNLNNLTFQ